MYCGQCRRERGRGKSFCVKCGERLAARGELEVLRDLGQQRFLLDTAESWIASGQLAPRFARELVRRNRSEVVLLLEALEDLRAPHDAPAVASAAPTPAPAEAVHGRARNFTRSEAADAAVVASALAPLPVQLPPAIEPAPPSETTPEVRIDAPATSIELVGEPRPTGAPEKLRVEPMTAAELMGQAEPPRPRERHRISALDASDGLSALSGVEAPPPSEAEKIIEKESAWSRVIRPFLYDNAVWFIGAFCVVSGSLYIASQAWQRLGEESHAFLVLGLLLTYAAGFVGAGWYLGTKKSLPIAGRILAVIGAALGPVALLALEPLRAESTVTFGAGAAIGLGATLLFVRTATSLFDARLTNPLTGLAAALLAWELGVPSQSGVALLGVGIPLAVLAVGTELLRRREAPLERAAQALTGLSLLYLAAFDLVRFHFDARVAPGLELYGPAVIALAGVALRAEYLRKPPEGERPALTAVVLGSLSLVAAGALCSLWTGTTPAAAALLATIVLVDAARNYRRAWFVGLAAVTGLFAYYLSPDLVPHGIEAVIVAARAALRVPPSQPLPIAFAGLTTLPYLAALGIVAHRSRGADAPWVYRPLAWVAGLDVVAMGILSHSSPDLRAALPASVGLVLLVGVALWLAPTAGAGYLFAFPATLLSIDLARLAGQGDASLAVGAAGAALLLAVVARATPALQRAPLLGMAALLAMVAPLGCAQLDTARPIEVVLGASLLAHLAVAASLRSRLFGFTAAALATALAAIAIDRSALPLSLQVTVTLAAAFACLALAALERERRFVDADPVRPFDVAAPLPATGFSLWADPLAALGLGMLGVALWRAAWNPGELVLRTTLALAALHVVLLARRYGWGWLTALAWTFATLACWGHVIALSVLGLALGSLSVALERSSRLARWTLHCEGILASWPAAVSAAALPVLALATHWYLHGQEHGVAWALWLGVATHLALLRWRPFGGAWLASAAALALAALYLPDSNWTPLGASAVALALAALAAFGATWWDSVTWTLGYSGKQLARVAGVLVHVCALVAIVIYTNDPASSAATVAAALLAMAYTLLARAEDQAVWLSLAGLFAVAALDPGYTARSADTLTWGALGLTAIANVLRAAPRTAELGLGVRPAARSGYALSAAALVALGLAAPHLFAAWVPSLPLHLAVAAAAVALAGRALGFAPLVAGAFGVGQLAIWARFDSLESFPPPALGTAAAMVAIAIGTRRFPALLCRVALDRSETDARERRLRASLLVMGCLLAIAGVLSGFGVHDESGVRFAGYLLVTAGLAIAAVLAAPSPAWLAAAGTLALLAGAVVSSDGSGGYAFVALHALLIASALARWAPAWSWVERAVRATSASGQGAGSRRRYARALSGTAVLAVAVCVAILAFAAQDRWLDGATDPSLVRFSLLAVIAAAHLLVHRRGPFAVAIALAVPTLALICDLRVPELGPALGGWALALGVLSLAILTPRAGRLLRVAHAPTPRERRRWIAVIALCHLLVAAAAAVMAVGLDFARVAMPVTYALLTAALLIAGGRFLFARALGLLGLPVAAHVALACLGVHISTGRPQEVILGAWAFSCGLLAIGAERIGRKARGEVLAAAHLYFAIGVLEIGAEIARLNGMHPSELVTSGLAIASLGVFAALRALDTKNEAYAYLAHAAVGALYVLVRLQSHLLGTAPGDDLDALSTVALAFAFLGIRALAERLGASVFERPARVVTHLLPMVGLFFAPSLTASQGASLALALSLHYACVAWATSGGRLATLLSGIALNAALIVTWLDRGISDPQFYALPFGATLLVFAHLFRDDLDLTGRYWLRTIGILVIYVASAISALTYSNPLYVMVCAGVCILGALLGVALRVRSYVYLGTACLLVDVLGNMARHGLQNHLLGGVFLTCVGLALVGGWVFFHSRREDLLRRYRQVQELMAAWE